MRVDHIKSDNHSVPPISGGSISPSGLLDTCMTAFPRMRQRENRWKSCLVAIPSSSPDCLAKAEASRLSWMTATLCNPPSVSAAIGRKEIPCSWQAAAAPCTFLSKADLRALPASAAAPATFVWHSGLVTVTSRAPSFPSHHLGRRTSAGLAAVPGSKNLPSLTGPRAALAAVSYSRSRSWLWRTIRSL